jgi:hypothetical protein
MMEKIEIFRLYQTQCDGAGFAMPLPDITSVEHQSTRPEKDQKNAAEMQLWKHSAPSQSAH